MPMQRDDMSQVVLSRLLEEHRLEGGSRLYREAERSTLTSTANAGVYRLAANPAPSESVVDVYGAGYVVQAEQLGPGLAFAESSSPNWQETMELRALRSGPPKIGSPAADRVEVEVCLDDLLRQGGLVYPFESVTVEKAWYFTLPQGSIDVRIVT